MATTSQKNRQHPVRTLLILVAVTALLYTVMAVNNIWTPKLGLDLRGGTTITLTAENTSGQGSINADSLEQARTIIQQRVDSVGVGESSVTTSGDNQIIVAVPNVAPDKLNEMVGQTAQLVFRPVYATSASEPDPAAQDPSASPSPQPSDGASTAPRKLPSAAPKSPAVKDPATTPGTTEAPAAKMTSDQILSWTPTAEQIEAFTKFKCGDPYPDVAEQPLFACDRTGTAKFLLAPAILRGDQLKDASSGTQQGQVTPMVFLQFNDEGAKIFEQASRTMYTKQEPQSSFAIVLDSKVISYPKFSSVIPDGRAQISGNFTRASAQDLANVLKYGALPLTFTLSEQNTVSPTLGGEQLQAGIVAGLIGLLLVIGYAVLYYRGLAVVVVASLALAAAVTYAFMVLLGESMGFALNLPGIAGAIVAIGITADSFVIYFERIRDEARDGRSLRTAIETGWMGSRKTIVVADSVTMLSAVVLFILAIGSVKGFAFTLGLTTLIDIAIVFFFTKPMVTLLGRTKFFGEGHRFSGFEPEHLGAKRVRNRRRPTSEALAKGSVR